LVVCSNSAATEAIVQANTYDIVEVRAVADHSVGSSMNFRVPPVASYTAT